MLKKITLLLSFFLILNNLSNAQVFRMPEEGLPHEGTWLQWPHHYQYGTLYRDRLDATWVAMTSALVSSEKVHIVAYDETEQTRITNLLTTASVPLTNVDFKIHPTDDVWVRDNGPIFVKNTTSGSLKIQDWGFNAWGGKFQYTNCNSIPTLLATDLGLPVQNLNATMVNEGGSTEFDGDGAMMACKSSILSQAPANTVRNLGMTQAQAENIFTTNLGITKFIWLNGVTGLEVTDMHIDGFARFANATTIVTMNQANLLDWGVPQTDINTLMAATNKNNVPYTFVTVPLTQNNVQPTYGAPLAFKGSYANYYIGNTKVLVPNYNDPNDAVANAIIQALYPGRTVVGIDVRNLYVNGGMVHCVTQQQPVGAFALPIELKDFTASNKGNDVELNWSTYSEINFSHFEIERSEDAIHFEKIATIYSDINHTSTKKYTYLDQNVFSGKKYYYRLRLFDNDEKSVYSMVAVAFLSANNNEVKIYPNPVFNSFKINCELALDEIKIYDNIGRILLNEKLNALQEINIATFQNGYYTYQIIAKNGQQFNGKFVKQ